MSNHEEKQIGVEAVSVTIDELLVNISQSNDIDSMLLSFSLEAEKYRELGAHAWTHKTNSDPLSAEEIDLMVEALDSTAKFATAVLARLQVLAEQARSRA